MSQEWNAKATYERYVRVQEDYRSALEAIEKRLIDYLDTCEIFPHMVTSRAKDPISLYRKQFDKNYPDPWVDCKDILGVRIIVSLASEKAKIRAAFENTSLSPFAVDKVEDKEESRDYKELRYGGLHIDLTYETPSSTLGERLGFEVQIRTIAEHTWAETEHSYIYKGPSGISDKTKRQFARVLALVELMDIELDRGVEAVSALESYGFHKLSRKLADTAATFEMSTGSSNLTEQNIEDLCAVLDRKPLELLELVTNYSASHAATLNQIIERIGPSSRYFDVDRHLLAAQPEMILVAALLNENAYLLGTKLHSSGLYELVLPIAREMGKFRSFASMD